MNLIEIRPPACLEEYEQACTLVSEVYSNQGIPGGDISSPGAMFVAVRDGVVLGSVGFRSGDQGPLPVEHHFGFHLAEVCFFSRGAVCEIVELAAKERAEHTVFRGLIAAVTQYAFFQQPFCLAFALLKPKLEKALQHILPLPSPALSYGFVQ